MFNFLKKLTGKKDHAHPAPKHDHHGDGCCGGMKKAPAPKESKAGCCGGHGHHNHNHNHQ